MLKKINSLFSRSLPVNLFWWLNFSNNLVKPHKLNPKLDKIFGKWTYRLEGIKGDFKRLCTRIWIYHCPFWASKDHILQFVCFVNNSCKLSTILGFRDQIDSTRFVIHYLDGRYFGVLCRLTMNLLQSPLFFCDCWLGSYEHRLALSGCRRNPSVCFPPKWEYSSINQFYLTFST